MESHISQGLAILGDESTAQSVAFFEWTAGVSKLYLQTPDWRQTVA